jgi:ribosomal protein L21E
MSKEIQRGDNVRVIVEVWKEDELPTCENFYQGKVLDVIERSAHCFYLQIEGLDRLIPIDRATV